jgi:hypothetical protein
MFFFKTFLLVSDSFTGSFVVIFPYIHVLYPGLIHLLHYYPSYPIPLLKITSTGFNVLVECSFVAGRN